MNFHDFNISSTNLPPLLPSFLNLDYDVCSTKCKYESWPFRNIIWFWTTCLCSFQCKHSFNFTFVSLNSTFTAIWHQHTNTQENNLCHHFFTTYMTTLESRAGLEYNFKSESLHSVHPTLSWSWFNFTMQHFAKRFTKLKAYIKKAGNRESSTLPPGQVGLKFELPKNQVGQ